MSAEFPPLDFAWQHSYSNGSNTSSATFSSDSSLLPNANNITPNYFLVDIEGQNKGDETTVASQKSQYTDSFYAKISALTTAKSGYSPSTLVTTSNLPTGSMIEYNDHSSMENVSHFNPPIGKLDRLRIRTRLHSQQGSQGFIYWSGSTSTATLTLTVASSSTQTYSALSAGTIYPGMILTGSGISGTAVILTVTPTSSTGGSFTVSQAFTSVNTASAYTVSGTTTATAAAANVNTVNFALTFEIEYLDNGFDQFSSLSTRLRPSDRA
jgi:hypothetical protein